MITFEEYKQYLLDYHRYKIDELPEKVDERKKMLKAFYPDDFLKKVVSDTYEFTKDIFECDTLKDGYCDFEIDEDTNSGIYLNISGGGNSDELYRDNNGKVISWYILHKLFGEYFDIEVRCDQIERECEDDVLSFDYHYCLYMQGFPDNMDEIKENLFGKSLAKKANKC